MAQIPRPVSGEPIASSWGQAVTDEVNDSQVNGIQFYGQDSPPIASGIETKLAIVQGFGDETMLDLANNQIVINKTGMYLINLHVSVTCSTAEQTLWIIQARVDGSVMSSKGSPHLQSYTHTEQLSDVFWLQAGQRLEAWVWNRGIQLNLARLDTSSVHRFSGDMAGVPLMSPPVREEVRPA